MITAFHNYWICFSGQILFSLQICYQPSNNQNSWNKITKMLKQAAENTIGYVNKSRKSINEDVKELSLLQRSIKIQIESCMNEENRTFLKIYRNRISTEIHFIIKNEENEKIKQTTAELENMNDSTKIYEAVKKIKRLRPPQKLLMKGKNGLNANPAEESKIIAEHFKKTFYKNNQPGTIISSTRMTIPFTAYEIRKATAKMKPNKSRSKGHTTSNPRRFDVNITSIRRKPNFDKLPRHFHVLSPT